jgi:hypothetical protein
LMTPMLSLSPVSLPPPAMAAMSREHGVDASRVPGEGVSPRVAERTCPPVSPCGAVLS